MDSNQQPTAYKAVALPIELQRLACDRVNLVPGTGICAVQDERDLEIDIVKVVFPSLVI